MTTTLDRPQKMNLDEIYDEMQIVSARIRAHTGRATDQLIKDQDKMFVLNVKLRNLKQPSTAWGDDKQ